MPPVRSPSKLTLTQIAMTTEADISTAESFLWPSELEFESRTGQSQPPPPPTTAATNPVSPLSLREVDTERSSPSDKTKSPFAWYVNRTRVGEKQMEKKEKFYKETKNYGPGIPGLVARVCRCGLCSPTLEKRPFKTMTRSRSTENTTDRASVCKTFSFQNLQLLSRTYYALAKSVLSVSHVLGVGFNLLNPKTD